MVTLQIPCMELVFELCKNSYLTCNALELISCASMFGGRPLHGLYIHESKMGFIRIAL